MNVCFLGTLSQNVESRIFFLPAELVKAMATGTATTVASAHITSTLAIAWQAFDERNPPLTILLNDQHNSSVSLLSGLLFIRWNFLHCRNISIYLLRLSDWLLPILK